VLAIVLTLLLAAAPFWEAKGPTAWSEDELNKLLTDSPWAQLVPGASANLPGVQVYLATAKPIQLAEAERERRARAKLKGKEPELDPFAEEYAAWLEENGKDQIILAILTGNHRAFNDSKELDRLEKESVLRVGRRKVAMTGYFPPSDHDPFLRIAFPRQVGASDETVRFDLYLPGVAGPFRSVEFQLEALKFEGRVEF
jgi:hypothetical protein